MSFTPPFDTIDVLRFTTAGSVDDGKSTLIGRLLYDSKSIFEDQLAAIEGASRKLGEDRVNLALLTDGLRAEREQKITIDVAYRYFATPRRKFIIADTPGHVQYTRNMVTGASTADLAVILVDATKGVLTQSKRHAFITSLLGIPHMIVAVNKMDLAGYEEPVYQRLVAEFKEFSSKLTIADVTFVPISALEGDNIVDPSPRMPWYQGGTLLHRLETVTAGARINRTDFRFPIQTVIRPNQTFRGFAGTVSSGAVKVGDEIIVLPSSLSTRVKSIVTFDGERSEAQAGDAIVVTTTDEIDISRGDMLVRKRNVPSVSNRLEAYLCWMSETPMLIGVPYIIAHTTREVQALVTGIDYRVDVDTLHRESVETLGLNEIGRVTISTARPLFFDSYRVNLATGCFVVIDPHTNVTVAAGMIRGEAKELPSAPELVELSPSRPASSDVAWEGANITRAEREARNGHAAAVVWFTGLSGAGKSAIARGVERQLFSRRHVTALLDGDHVRQGLCGDLGFAPAERTENIRRVGEVARLFFEQGSLALCAFVSPYRADRARVRDILPAGRFVEVFVKASADVCQARDPKGLYARASRGELADFTGVAAPYEEPADAELVIDTETETVEASVDRVIAYLLGQGLIPQAGA